MDNKGPTIESDAIDNEAMAAVEAPKPLEPAEAPRENQPPPEGEESPRDRALREKIERRSDLKLVWRLVNSGGLENDELMRHLGPWAEKFAGKAENLAEVLDYFEQTEKIIDRRLSPEQRADIASALAELVADGYLDAESLQALAGRIEYGITKNGEHQTTSGTLDRVAEYNPERLGIIVYDELFEDIEGVPQNITHILKGHEISHGLNRWGEIIDDEMLEKTNEIINDSEGLKLRETFRSTNAIDQYLAVKNRDGATAEEIEKRQKWLCEELLSEKTAAYLQSSGDFGSFIEAQLEVMPWENVKKLFDSKDSELSDRWLAENKFFFDKIAARMQDKTALKEKILASTEEARAELAGHYNDDDFDWDDFLGGGFGEPGIPDNSKTTVGQRGGAGNDWIAGLRDLAEAFGSEMEKSIPGTEELKKAA